MDFLSTNYPGCRLLQDALEPAVVSVQLSVSAKNDLAEFARQRRSSVVTALTRNDTAPVRCRFDDRVKVAAKGGEEIVNQFHPLVRFSAAEAERQGAIGFPAIAARIPLMEFDPAIYDTVRTGDYLVAVSRWTFEALRVSEQLWFAVMPVDDLTPFSDEDAERFVMTVAEFGQDWNIDGAGIAAADVADVIEQSLLARAQDDFEKSGAAVKAQNEDRADAQLRSLQTHLASQRAKYEALRERHVSRGNPGLARAQEVNIERLAARIDREREAVNAKRQVRSRLDEVAVGIVRVY
jgi:hypothetical protein